MRGFARLLPVLAAVVSLALPTPASARNVVANKRFDQGGRLEVMVTPAMSAFDKYTRHVSTSAGVAYHFNDYIGLELDAGYAFVAGDRKLLTEILKTAENLTGITRLPLSDLKYTTWWALAGAVFSPLYGKLNLSSELAINFHLFLTAGAGAAEYRYHQLDPAAPTRTIEYNEGVKPTFYAGGGLRVHFTRDWSMRLEIRDHFFYDEYKAEHKPAGTNVEPKTINDFVHITMFRLGVCYAF